jgi:hypothetical protein
MTSYTVTFPSTAIGLSLDDNSFLVFERQDTGAAPTNPAPSVITEVGLGAYRFDYEAAEDVFFILDAGASVDGEARYVRGIMSPRDEHLDVAVSTRATQTSVNGLPSAASIVAAIRSQGVIDTPVVEGVRVLFKSGDSLELEFETGFENLTDQQAVVFAAVKTLTEDEEPVFLSSSYPGGDISLDTPTPGVIRWRIPIAKTSLLPIGRESPFDIRVSTPGELVSDDGTATVEAGSGVVTFTGADLSSVKRGDMLFLISSAPENSPPLFIDTVGLSTVGVLGYDGFAGESGIEFSISRGERASPQRGLLVCAPPITP